MEMKNGYISKTYSRGDGMIGFSESTEYQTTTLNNIRVIAFYYGMLGRAPSAWFVRFQLLGG